MKEKYPTLTPQQLVQKGQEEFFALNQDISEAALPEIQTQLISIFQCVEVDKAPRRPFHFETNTRSLIPFLNANRALLNENFGSKTPQEKLIEGVKLYIKKETEIHQNVFTTQTKIKNEKYNLQIENDSDENLKNPTEMNRFILFFTNFRNENKLLRPEVHIASLFEEARSQWKSMTDEEKDQFYYKYKNSH